MTKMRQGFQNIYYKPRNIDGEIEVDWESWTLKLSKDELHTLQFNLMYPDEWIDTTTNTGLTIDIGDEIGLYASFSNERGNTIKRFGGTVQSIDGETGEKPNITIQAVDWRYALKNKIIFSNYKSYPLLMSRYSYLVGQMRKSTNLYDIVTYLCEMVNFTDLDELTNPYGFKMDGSSNLTRTVGTNSLSTIITGMGVPSPCYEINYGSGDTEVVFTIYSDGTGFDLSEYPNFAFNYFHPPNQLCEYGFRFTINNIYYYLPFFSSLSSYSGNKLRGLNKVTTSSFGTMVAPIGDLMMEQFPDTMYTLTKVELVAKRSAGVMPGTVYFDNFGMIENDQTPPQLEDYTYKSALDIINEYCKKTNNFFEITPEQKPIIHNSQYYLSDKYLIEGVNVISATTKFNDSNLINNLYVVSKLEEKKAMFAQAVNQNSVTKHGLYEKVDEQSDFKEQNEIKDYANNQVATNSYITPSITCEVVPEFVYFPGEVIYVYIPSLGIERSLEIQTISYTSDGGCTIELGLPDNLFHEMLKDLNKNQKIGLTRGVKNFDKTNHTDVDGQFSTVYKSPQGKVYITGKDLVETVADINNDMNNGVPVWVSTQMRNKVHIDERGVEINWTGNTKNKLTYRQSTLNDVNSNIYDLFSCDVNSGLTTDSDNQKSGRQCLKATINTSSTNIAEAIVTLHGAACTPGNKVSGGFQMKSPNNITVQPCIRFYNNGVYVNQVYGTQVPVTSSYQQFKLEDVTVPATSTHYTIKFRIYGSAGNVCYVDELQINDGSTLNTYEDGGSVVRLPVGIVIHNSRFADIKTVNISATQASFVGTFLGYDSFYDQMNPLDLEENRYLTMELLNFPVTDGYKVYTYDIYTLSPPLKNYQNVMMLVNDNKTASGTTTITKKEIIYSTT